MNRRILFGLLVAAFCGVIPTGVQATDFGIVYELWHCPYAENTPYPQAANERPDGSGTDTTIYNMTQAKSGQTPWGPLGYYHWRDRPKDGYYCLARNPDLLRRHAEQIRDAGIDFVFIDASNWDGIIGAHAANPKEMVMDSYAQLLAVWSTVPNAPKIAIWAPMSTYSTMGPYLLNRLNEQPYQHLKYLYEGKPLWGVVDWLPKFPLNQANYDYYSSVDSPYTVRKMWAFKNGTTWSFQEHCANSANFVGQAGNTACNQPVYRRPGQTTAEQVGVTFAYQNYLVSNSQMSASKFDGRTFVRQFDQVFANRGVPIVSIAGWNDWIGIRYCVNGDGEYVTTGCVTDQFPDGNKMFVDTYVGQYNRDIEPDAVFGDYYLRLMKKCIAAYDAGASSCDEANVPASATSPAPGGVGPPNTTFSWSQAWGRNLYIVDLSEDPNFSWWWNSAPGGSTGMTARSAPLSAITNTTYSQGRPAPAQLVPGRTYYWRIFSQGNGMPGIQSAVSSFIVGSNPVGEFQSANCTEAVGYACDGDNYNTPLLVDFWAGGVYVGGTTANLPGDATVAAACGGNAAHRFAWPIPSSLKHNSPIPYTLRAFAINIAAGAHQELPVAKTIICLPNPPPSIITQPQSQTVTAPQSATFSVTASGNAMPLSYQWQSATALSPTIFSNISGATSATYNTGPTALSQNGKRFQVIVSNSDGTRYSNAATLTVNAPLPPPVPTGLMATCNTAGNQVTLSWNASLGADNYLLRIDNTANNTASCSGGWFCSDPPDKISDYYVGTSLTMAVIPLDTYNFWMHSNSTSGGYSAAAGFNFNCYPPLPVITSAGTATGRVGTTFSYQITATNSPTSFGATGLPAGLSINTTSGLISGTPTATGTYTITLTARNAGGTGTRTLTLTVSPPLALPVITSAATATGRVGTAFSYQITATNSPTSFGATGLPAGLSINTTTGLISGTPTATGSSTITLTARNAGGTGTRTLVLTVNPPLPVITSAATATGRVGTAFSYQITATNSPTSFGATGLPVGLSINTGSGLISGTPTATGTYTITLTARNASGTGTRTLTLTVTPPLPVITSTTTATGRVGTAFSYQIIATNSPTSFGATGLPAGLSINSTTGLISGTPTATGTSTITLTARNASGTGTRTLTLTVNPALPLPVITSTTTATGRVGTAFSYQITATNSPTSFGATGLPAGLSINSTTGLISGTPTATGTSNITLTARNAGGTGTRTLVLTVNPPPPVITSAGTATGNVGSVFNYQIIAGNTATSYGATGLPAGLSINTTTGLISGTPTATGTYTITLTARNAGGTGTRTLTLTVNSPLPVITSAATATGRVGTAFSYQIIATNSPTSFAATGLPAGLSINTTSGLISGTPTATGTSNITLTARNAGGTGTRTLTLTVNPPLPVITSAGTATGNVGSVFNYQITATNSPTSFGATGLPAGLSINTTTGLISGTPTATGTYTITLTARNAGGTGTRTLTLTVNVPTASPAPVITSAGTATGRVGTAFSYQITATNSPTSFVALGLPMGLSFNPTSGLISGTPATAGTYNISLIATNGGGSGTRTLTLSISLASPLLPVSTALDAVHVYPSPWRANLHSANPITFQGLSVNNTVKIFTVSGRHVKTLGPANGSVTWNLTNDSGDAVASGLYLYLATDAQNNNARGKFSIIR